MAAVLDKAKFIPSCTDGKLTPALGLVVGLRRCRYSKDDTNPLPFVVVGQCACEPLQTPLADLVRFSLPSPDWTATREKVARHFPGGCEECGVWVRMVEGCSRERVQELMDVLQEKTDLQGIGKENVLLVVVTPTTANQSEQVMCYACDCNGPIRLQPVEQLDNSVEDYLLNNTRLLRVQASFSLYLPAGDKAEKKEVTPLINQVLSSSTAFYISSHQLLFSERKLSESESLRSVLPKREQNDTQGEPLSVELLEDASRDCERPPSAPLISCETPFHREMVEMSVPVDVVGVFPFDSSLSTVAGTLKSTVAAQLRATGEAIYWKDDGVCSFVEVHHFPLPTQCCPVTVVYPYIPQKEKEGEGEVVREQQLHPLRLKMHQTFCLPTDRPFLRTINRHCFEHTKDTRLINVHTAVKYTPVPGGTVGMVQGRYAYHHYMQDKFNDDGWGCAYRSLQTLWSWFVLQGYTHRPPPTHRQIQEALVEVGEERSSFVGSTHWIGSFEVRDCLAHLMGVECKILHCSSGSEMAGVGRDLLHHFNKQGTPVMIGGGELAHTILGVDFCGTTGEIQFLILDPHYTGKDELKTIVAKAPKLKQSGGPG